MFEYVVPAAQNVMPTIGPSLGGTLLTVTGDLLAPSSCFNPHHPLVMNADTSIITSDLLKKGLYCTFDDGLHNSTRSISHAIANSATSIPCRTHARTSSSKSVNVHIMNNGAIYPGSLRFTFHEVTQYKKFY